MQAINVIFDGQPCHESGRFVEVEIDEGKSVCIGKWIERPDGYWALRFNVADVPEHPVMEIRQQAITFASQHVGKEEAEQFADTYITMPGGPRITIAEAFASWHKGVMLHKMKSVLIDVQYALKQVQIGRDPPIFRDGGDLIACIKIANMSTKCCQLAADALERAENTLTERVDTKDAEVFGMTVPTIVGGNGVQLPQYLAVRGNAGFAVHIITVIPPVNRQYKFLG